MRQIRAPNRGVGLTGDAISEPVPLERQCWRRPVVAERKALQRAAGSIHLEQHISLTILVARDDQPASIAGPGDSQEIPRKDRNPMWMPFRNNHRIQTESAGTQVASVRQQARMRRKCRTELLLTLLDVRNLFGFECFGGQ